MSIEERFCIICADCDDVIVAECCYDTETEAFVWASGCGWSDDGSEKPDEDRDHFCPRCTEYREQAATAADAGGAK